MAKSRPFQPGDSAPDFSHLADHDAESDEPQWSPGGDDPSADAADDDEPAPAPQQAAGDTPPQRDDPANTDPADSPAGDSHVFFEADNPVSDDELAGETTAFIHPDEQPGAAADDSSRAAPQDEADPDRVLRAAPGGNDPPLSVSADKATQLTDVGIPVFVDPPDSGQARSDDAGEDSSAAASDEVAADETAAGQKVRPAGAASSTKRKPRPAARTERPEPVAPSSAAAGDRQRLLLILLASYASAITIAFLWLWLARGNARPHELESLPDVAPLGPNEFRYAPQNASMPRGHTLPLGSEQQLGYIKVEPLRVTRGPVQFAHFSDPAQSKPPTGPVLKLWLRFTNVSSDQLIAPLDAPLLLTRSYQVETDSVLANQLLLPADKSSKKPAYVIDHPTTSEWDLAGQKLGHRLKPGESLETYIPLEPGSESHLDGDLLWRVHFRKGYHDATGHGVTTMIEVPFSTADVQTESATAT